MSSNFRTIAIQEWIELTEQVCDTANRRVLAWETVPNQDKLFSLFETHKQLYKRGKAGEPIQHGRLALVFEDGAGFISHYCLMDRTVCDADVISVINAIRSFSGIAAFYTQLSDHFGDDPDLTPLGKARCCD